MNRTVFRISVFLACFLLSPCASRRVSASTVDGLIKGMDDDKRTGCDLDYAEAVMNAKLQAMVFINHSAVLQLFFEPS